MILYRIIESTKVRVAKSKQQVSLDELKRIIQDVPQCVNFKEAVAKDGMSFICEVKKASPSKGVIDPKFDYKQIAIDYETGGADAISVLTEPEMFLGSEQYLEEISRLVSIPTLKKDFVIDEYQIYQAKASGASAVLLICSALGDELMKRFLDLTWSLGMNALIESHDQAEVERSLQLGADIIGVNNRNLKTMEVSLDRCMQLRQLVPPDKIYVAESGIKNSDDIKRLHKANVNAVLIGETFMRESNKAQAISNFRGASV